jgi:cobalt-zinc-cadmium efflux system membrane fusion protein
MKKIISIVIILMIFSCEKNNQTEKVNTQEKISITKEEVKKESPIEQISLNPESIKNYGIKSQISIKKPYIETINTTGLIKETENSVYKINSPVQGKVIYDGVKIGDYVKSGQKIASIQNSEVTKIYSNYIHESHNNEILVRQAKIKLKLSEKNLFREKSLFEQGISSRKDYESAKTEVELLRAEIEGLKEHETHLRSEANALLMNYDVKLGNSSSEEIISVSPIIAPNSGVITKKNITKGTVITTDEEIYQITDLSIVYLNITVQDKDIKKIKIGQNVIFTSDVIDDTFQGSIDNISFNVNPENQSFIVRAKLDNSKGYLKSGTFGNVKISLTLSKPMIFIPNESVQSYNNEKFIFVETKENNYKKIVVNPYKSDKDGIYLSDNTNENKKVVTYGAFILKSELLKNEFKEEE